MFVRGNIGHRTGVEFGTITDATIGLIMRECAVRAIRTIRRLRFNAEGTIKGIKPNGKPDWVSKADPEAQKMYLKLLQEHFPGIGVIAEEEELRVPCTIPGLNAYFTVDPLDGTQAYLRKQSDSVGTMISLVVDGNVVAVCIGDVMTNELYYFRPGSVKTHWIDLDNNSEPPQQLEIDPNRTLQDQYLLLRDPVDRLRSKELLKFMVQEDKGLVENYLIACGSIGITTAKLWKGEVGAAVLSGQKSTPWDDNPVIGMSLRLGFLAYKLLVKPTVRIVSTELHPTEQVNVAEHDVLLIHKSRRAELAKWCETRHIELIDRH